MAIKWAPLNIPLQRRLQTCMSFLKLCHLDLGHKVSTLTFCFEFCSGCADMGDDKSLYWSTHLFDSVLPLVPNAVVAHHPISRLDYLL